MNQSHYDFCESDLTALRESVLSQMSPKRFAHTAAVEDMVARLATLYCPEETVALRAAALLHDLTKEYKNAAHIILLEEAGETVTDGDRHAPKTLHARTAALLIPKHYPAFNCETVVNAVRWHTTGREGMTLTEQLLYLADYIDDSRIFPDCVRLRSYFWNARPETMSREERLTHLRRTLIMSYDMTMRALINEGAVISPDTALARNELTLTELMATDTAKAR